MVAEAKTLTPHGNISWVWEQAARTVCMGRVLLLLDPVFPLRPALYRPGLSEYSRFSDNVLSFNSVPL